MSMDKTELRAVLKEKRFSLSPLVRQQKSEMICQRLVAETAEFSVIMAYVAKEPEVETLSYIEEMIDAGKQVVLPIIERETHTLRLSLLTDVRDLSVSTFKVLEPVSAEKPVSSSMIECVILPLIGFDAAGNRIGYGAGYYDRFLAENPQVKKIGLAYACQEVPFIPAEAFDVRMDEVITEE